MITSDHAMTVDVNREICVSSGNCALTAPDVFDQGDEDGIVVLLDAHPSADHEAGVEQAEELCPVRAIHVTRAE